MFCCVTVQNIRKTREFSFPKTELDLKPAELPTGLEKGSIPSPHMAVWGNGWLRAMALKLGCELESPKEFSIPNAQVAPHINWSRNFQG